MIPVEAEKFQFSQNLKTFPRLLRIIHHGTFENMKRAERDKNKHEENVIRMHSWESFSKVAAEKFSENFQEEKSFVDNPSKLQQITNDFPLSPSIRFPKYSLFFKLTSQTVR